MRKTTSLLIACFLAPVAAGDTGAEELDGARAPSLSDTVRDLWSAR